MQKAANINELANNLIPEKELKPEDKDVYVGIYDDVLDDLRNMVVENQVSSQAFFVAGQSGTGKTTALNYFKSETLKKRYHIKYINMSDYLELGDVDIIDFLLTFAFALVENTDLEETYYERLEEITQLPEGPAEAWPRRHAAKPLNACPRVWAIPWPRGGPGGGFFNFIKLRGRFFANLRMDSDYRQITREVFKLKKPALHNLINEVIADYVEKITGGKPLLVIIDDLDKLRKVGQINSIFIENRNYIFNLECKKIISIPMYLTKAPEISNYSHYPIPQFILRLSPNPFEQDKKVIDKDKKKIETNRQMLRKVIKCRVKKDCSLIEDEALEEAIDYSGGILRQLIRIIYIAAVNVRAFKGKKISLPDVTDAIGKLKNQMAGTILSTRKIKLLGTILNKNIPVSEEKEDFIELLLANNVLAYENGDPWYEVNPIISKTVKTYAARQEE